MHPLSIFAHLRGRLRALFRRSAVERQFADEIRFHLEMETQRHVDAGMSPRDAHRAALLSFGGVERVREDHRDARGERWLEDAMADVRYALRWLSRSRGFTVAAVTTLALGIGGTTAAFCVVDGVLLKPLPYPEAERLVGIWSSMRGTTDPWGSNPPDFREFRERATAFDGLGGFFGAAANVVIDDVPVRLGAARATAAIFPMLGANPLLGRIFREEEESYGNDRVVLLSHAAWTNKFGGQPEIVGTAITIDGQPHTVVGVLPASFRFPDRTAELWLPMAFAPDDLTNNRNNYFVSIIGRVRRGTTLEAARADIERVAAQVAADYPESSMRGAVMMPLHEQTVGSARVGLLFLLGATALLLAIACANVAGLLLARSTARQRELAVRAGLGATRGRLVRQLVAESVVLSAVGALAGIAFAALALRAVRLAGPMGVPRLEDVAMDARVLLVALGTAVVCAVAFGIWPALRLTRNRNADALRGGTRTSASAHHQRARRLLVAAQVGLALVLLVGAGLLLRSFVAMMQVDPGFRAANIVTASLPVRSARYPTAERTWSFADDVLSRISAIPRVESVALTSGLSLRGGSWGKRVTFGDRAQPTSLEQVPTIGYRLVSQNYFSTLGIRILSGRSFETTDRAGTPAVAIINETLAKRFFGDASPIGKTLWLGPPEHLIASLLPAGYRFPRLTVVGVAADERFTGLDVPPQPEVYAVYSQSTETSFALYVAVRSSRDAASLVGDIRAALREVEPTMPLAEVATAQQLMRDAGAKRRFSAMLVLVFAALALGLAVVGIYGVVAQFVTQRTRELGIRMALGANDRRVVRLVLWEGLATASVGLVVGLAAAFALSGAMREFVFGISPLDPVTFVVVPSLLLAAVTLATVLPAVKATRISPALVLRSD